MWVLEKRVANAIEQRLRIGLAVHHPARIENLVAAVFAVGLSEHHQLGVRRVAPQLEKAGLQVVDLVKAKQRVAPAGLNEELAKKKRG